MDLTSLIKGEETSSGSPVIQKDVDPGKYDAIAAKLCDNRRDVEEKISSTEGTEREELAIRLLELKKGMSIFGITEIDYQAYVAQKEKDTTKAMPIPEPSPTATVIPVSLESTSEDLSRD